jgi:hypothetical protein
LLLFKLASLSGAPLLRLETGSTLIDGRLVLT